jgi:hypothetical protein
MSGLQQKYLVFHEITVGATSIKHAIYKEQASSSKKQVLLTQMQQSSTSRNEFFKDICNWMGLRMSPGSNSKCPNFVPFWKSTASNIFQTNQHFEKIICLSAMKKPWKT